MARFRRTLALLTAVCVVAVATAVLTSVAFDADTASATDATTDATLRAALSNANVTHIDVLNDIAMTCGSGTFIRAVGSSPLVIDGHGNKIDATGCNVQAFLDATAGKLTLSHVTITGGNATGTGAHSGGGVGVEFAGLVLDHSVVRNNTASTTSTTGGIAYAGGIYSKGPVTLLSSSVINNTASCTGCEDLRGGGIFMDEGGALTLINSTVSGNQLSGSATIAMDGGGIDTNSLTARYSTIVNNSGAPASANLFFQSGTPANIFATVIALHSGSASSCNVSGHTPPVVSSYSWDDDGSCAFAGPGDHSDAGDPLLDALAANGGPTPTMAPHTGTSGLIDAIPTGNCHDSGATNVVTDQRDFVRPHQTAGACDIGAVEVHPGGVSGTFTPVAPFRILDTRNGTGLSGAFTPQQTRDLTVSPAASTPPVPATGVEAVVLNVTATAPSAAGWLTLFPTGSTLPTASNLNFSAGQTVPNLVTVKTGTAGKVSINNTGGNPAAGSVQVIADIVGYYTDATGPFVDKFTAIPPSRILDTRNGTGLSGAFTPNQHRTLIVSAGGVPTTADAVVLNVTATAPSAAGWLTVFPSLTTIPNASNLNFVAGQTVPNLVVAKTTISAGQRVVDIANTDVPTPPQPASGTVHVIADVVGYYEAGVGTAVVAMPAQRILDTRNGTGGVTGPVAPNGTVTVDPRNAEGLPPAGSYSAVIVNVTATAPTQGGWLTAFPSDATIPNASNLNFVGGQTVANLVKVKVGADGTFKITNTDVPTLPHPSSGTVQIIVDIVGWFR